MSNIHHFSAEAQAHLRAFKRFYLWAGPLHATGHIAIAKNSANLDKIVSKRFQVSGGNKRPSVEVSHSEMEWISSIPWASAGINLGSSRLYLFAKPAEPIKHFAITIPLEEYHDLEPFRELEWLEVFLTGETHSGIPAPVRIKLAVVSGNGSMKKKHKK